MLHRTELARAGRVALVCGTANLVAYIIIAQAIGGDAMAGRAEGGRYFLSNNGILTETTRGLFLYSQIHTLTTWISLPIAVVGGVISIRRRGTA